MIRRTVALLMATATLTVVPAGAQTAGGGGDDPVIPTTPGSGGAEVPDDSDDRRFEIALLVMGVAAIVLGTCLVALSRRRRPRPRSPLPAVSTSERAGSLTSVTTTRDTTSVGRRT